jgi:hypothetical protein
MSSVVPLASASGRTLMKSVILWLLGVPIVVIILLNVTGMLGH